MIPVKWSIHCIINLADDNQLRKTVMKHMYFVGILLNIIYIYIYIYIYIVIVYGHHYLTWRVNAGTNFAIILNTAQ